MNTIDSDASDQVFLRVMKYLVIFAPAIIYLSFVQQFALNLPHYDDYDAILDFLVQFKTGSLGQKVSLLFKQHNEHRILSSRIVYVFYYYVLGPINFRNIIFIHAGILLMTFFVFLSFVKRALPLYWPVAALALSLCMFDIDSHENAQFAMNGMQNYGILLLFVSSMYFYNKDGKRYLPLAVLLQGLCVFSSGNGNVASFFIMLFVLMNRNRQKNIVAIVSFLVFAPLYYINYKNEAIFFTSDPAKFVPYFIHAIGAHFGFSLGLVMGVIVIVGYLLTFPLKKNGGIWVKDNTAFFIAFAGFGFSSMGVLALFRANQPLGPTASRYLIYTHLLVAILFILVLIQFEKKQYVGSIAIAGLLILFGVYRKNYNEGREAFVGWYGSTKNSQYEYPPDVQQHAKAITERACQLKIYCIEEARAKIK